MIVADVNVIAYLYLPGKFSEKVEDLLLRDGEWAVPRLWRSEFRNILSAYMRQKLLTLDAAMAIDARAEALVADNEYDVSSLAVLKLAAESGCSAYDCEYVALAEHLDAKVVSADSKLRKAFPKRVVSLSEA
ncbi:MAG: type II toxin-antitoxin system VapC family toxin [Burkholderiaceae bacterium]|nr:type II toxin-antitoxin system VapC family toxin [Aquabacterium sp.]NUP84964.1 type II toxin-antitoxin system VapC family toxin [Burkholderiaceae bacterium]